MIRNCQHVQWRIWICVLTSVRKNLKEGYIDLPIYPEQTEAPIKKLDCRKHLSKGKIGKIPALRTEQGKSGTEKFCFKKL